MKHFSKPGAFSSIEVNKKMLLNTPVPENAPSVLHSFFWQWFLCHMMSWKYIERKIEGEKAL